jgi:23S rRNA pseudouridine1911/1915/1917 synthase
MPTDRPRLKRQPLRVPRWGRDDGVTIYTVPPYAHRFRLDAFLTRVVGQRSRAEWQRLIELGAVLLRGQPAKASLRVADNDVVKVLPTPAHVELRSAADLPLNILYEDRAMVVLDKEPGMVVHPAPGHEEGTLVNALLTRFPNLADPTGHFRPGIVHRLDKDTSGLLVIGKTAEAVAALQSQMKDRTVSKRYTLLVHGTIAEEEGLIDAPIGRDLSNRQKMSVRADGRPSQTGFRVLERFPDHTLVDADLLTGRTHQLRVHFAFIDHPVAGDSVYGRRKFPPGLTRQFVHARELKIRSPQDGRPRRFEAPLPPDLTRVLDQLRPRLSRPPAAEELPEEAPA